MQAEKLVVPGAGQVDSSGVALEMSAADLQRVAAYIDKQVGIQLPMAKKSLVEGRLRKRVVNLGFNSFSAYLDHVIDSADGVNERLQLIDVLTTNKTNFFREPKHFEYLVETVVPQRLAVESQGAPFRIWSAGCSTGEEPYTLAMVLEESRATHHNSPYEILATDISRSCLQTASHGIYTERQIEPVPVALRKKYLLKSRVPGEQLVQMGPEIRKRIHFDSCNLMQSTFPVKHRMDAIFCRNVMIYFNTPTKEALVNRFEKQLLPGGYLFVGHSESLSGMQTGMKQVAPMVYRKGDG